MIYVNDYGWYVTFLFYFCIWFIPWYNIPSGPNRSNCQKMRFDIEKIILGIDTFGPFSPYNYQYTVDGWIKESPE